MQIIGEAARALSSDLKDQHPEMPWSKIIGMRNILVHDYFGIDVDVVWAVVERVSGGGDGAGADEGGGDENTPVRVT